MKSCFQNWSDLRIFLAVMRSGSTLAASRELSMAQPTVARRIDVLEHELGLTLFERTSRGSQPTADAKALLSKAEAMEAAATAFSAAARTLARPRPIRITAYGRNFSVRVHSLFSEFAATHPNVDFELIPTTQTLDLLAGEADIAIRLLRNPPHPDLIRRQISAARFALFGSTDYANRNGLPTSLEEMSKHQYVSYRQEGVPTLIDDWLRTHVPDTCIKLTFAEAELTTNAIASGHGLGIVNLRMAESYPDLIQCMDPIEDLTTDHAILIAPAAYRRPEVRSFIRFFAPRYAAFYK